MRRVLGGIYKLELIDALLLRLFLTLTAIGFPLKAYSVDGELANSINHTGMFLYYITEKSDNTVMSPLAICSSLMMAYMGAAGETAHQIANGLHLTMPQNEVPKAYLSLSNHLTEGGGKVEIGTTMWVTNQSNILRSYKSIISSNFNGSIHSVNFRKPLKAAQAMDEWVYERSQGKIAKFIDPSILSPSTRMILINSLLLKGAWESPFPTQSTGQEQFLRKDGNTVPCKMMRQTSELYYFQNEDTQVVALPIENLNSHLAFVIFLPRKMEGDTYDFYYSQDESKKEGFISYLNMLKKTYVNLSLPKFIVSQKLNLIPLYQALGISTALTKNADFSGIDGAKDLMISHAYQHSVLSIDEGGIFATAAASASFGLKATRSDDAAIVVANHPFLYAVYDFDTNLLLFLGECQDPTHSGILTTKGGSPP